MPRRRRRAPALGQAVLAAQTSAFTECFGFDGFYAEACLALFLPGLLIQFLQNRLDHKFDRLTSSSGLVESTAKLNIGRVIVGHLLQLAALLAFLIVLQSDLPHGGASAQRSDHVRYVMLGMFVLIGFGSGNTATLSRFLSLSVSLIRTASPIDMCSGGVRHEGAGGGDVPGEVPRVLLHRDLLRLAAHRAGQRCHRRPLQRARTRRRPLPPLCAAPPLSHCARGALRSELRCRRFSSLEF